MTQPSFTMRQLLEAGVHFGHHTRRWNPKMKPFIFGARNKVHIINLEETVPMLYQAMEAVRDTAAGGGRVLFVGTKRQAQDKVAEAGRRTGQYFVNHRWLGGMLTNWSTISGSIKRLKELDAQLAREDLPLTKRELLSMTRQRDKLDRALGGIKDMGGRPDILVVVDINKEHLAVREANKLGIPTVGVVDTNCDPEEVTYPVPGNDDARRAIELYLDLFAGAVLEGLQAEMAASGVDSGAASETVEPALDATATEAEAEPEAEAEAEAETGAGDGAASPQGESVPGERGSGEASETAAARKAAANA